MQRVVKFFNQLRRPQYIVAQPGDVVLINGVAYAVYSTNLTRIPIKPYNNHN